MFTIKQILGFQKSLKDEINQLEKSIIRKIYRKKNR